VSIITVPSGKRLRLESKGGGQAADLLAADDATGVVEAIVSVTGVVDEDDDLIEPGAYADTLKKRRPKGIFSHDWKRWVSRTDVIEEWMPGDPRLPEKTKDGQPWPKEAGALYVKTIFNMKTDTGRNAYHDVKFFSDAGECEWSIGYRVPRGKGARGKDGIRHIKGIDLWEYSPVLFGSASLSGTLSVKSADGGEAPADEEADYEPIPDPGAAAGEANDADGSPATADTANGTAAAPDGAAPGEAGQGAAPPDPTAGPMGDQEAADLHAAAAADPDFAAAVVVPEPTADAAAQNEPTRDAPRTDEVRRYRFTGPDDGENKRAFTAEHRRQMAADGRAMPDGSYPIDTATDLQNAIQAYGRADEKDRPAVRRHIIARARALRRLDLLPDDWRPQDKAGAPGVADTPQDQRAVARLKNWYLHGQGAVQIRWNTPGDWERCLHIAEKHFDDPEHAKGWCANLHHTATGEWPGPNAHGGGKKDADVVESMRGMCLPGTLEELRDEAREAAAAKLAVPLSSVAVLGTWPDRIVVSAVVSAPADGQGKGQGTHAQAYEMPYARKADGGLLVGDPVGVSVSVSVPNADGDEEKVLPYAGVLNEVAQDIEALAVHGVRGKAGRVLSAANERLLKAAVENLIAVLEKTGVQITMRAEPVVQPEQPIEQPDSTAPSAASAKAAPVTAAPVDTVAVDADLLARARDIMADARARTNG
jgi:phage head maturation protease